MPATPSTTFTEIVSTTLRAFPHEFADNTSLHNGLYYWLKRRNKIEMVSGGYEVQMGIDYQDNGTYQRFSGYDILNIANSDVLTSAKYEPVQAAIHISMSGREKLMNRGAAALAKLAKERLANAKRTVANNMSVDLYSTGALANQMGGLTHIIPDDGAGTVGGIDSATWTVWKSQFLECSSTPSSSVALRPFMNTMWLKCVRGTDRPDVIVMSHDWYSLLENETQVLQRYTDADTASIGFENLRYKSATVIFDSNVNFSTTAEKAFFINTDFLKLHVWEGANWNQSETKISVNQDAEVIPLLFMGTLGCNNRALQGVLIDKV